MRFGITTMGCDAGRSGISSYLRQLLEHLERVGGEHSWELITLEEEESVWLPGREMSAVRVSNAFRQPVVNVAWHQLLLPRLCLRREYDALFLPAANRRTPIWSPIPTVGVVHDFSFLHVPGKYDAARTFYQSQVLPRMIRRLDRVITISESSKRDIVAHARVPAERITVIPHGVDHRVFRPTLADATERPMAGGRPVEQPYVLYISRLEHPAKNHVPLIQAFDLLKTRERVPHRLVLAGGDWHGASAIHAAARSATHREDISFLGFVPTSELPALYRGAELFVFPSLYEGFGMPILEALACGVPVACSNVSSLPEVAGDAAILFEPASVEDIAHALRDGLLERAPRGQLVARGLRRAARFRWEETARRTIALIEQATNS